MINNNTILPDTDRVILDCWRSEPNSDRYERHNEQWTRTSSRKVKPNNLLMSWCSATTAQIIADRECLFFNGTTSIVCCCWYRRVFSSVEDWRCIVIVEGCLVLEYSALLLNGGQTKRLLGFGIGWLRTNSFFCILFNTLQRSVVTSGSASHCGEDAAIAVAATYSIKGYCLSRLAQRRVVLKDSAMRKVPRKMKKH
jgi:hypothetical protein